MKGFLQWFKRESKMKRWILLVLIGVLLSSYGMLNLLIGKVLNFGEILKIILTFVAGFTLIIIGIVYIQKRTLELFVQETDARDEAREGNVKSLILILLKLSTKIIKFLYFCSF